MTENTFGRTNMANPPCPGSDDDPLFHHDCNNYSDFPSLNLSNVADASDFELEQLAARGPVLVYVATSDTWGSGGATRHMSSAYALDTRGVHFSQVDPFSFGGDYATP